MKVRFGEATEQGRVDRMNESFVRQGLPGLGPRNLQSDDQADPRTTSPMEERARIPPGLPRESPSTSYWQDPPADIADLLTSPELPSSADYVIVGSGISGISIALNILSKSPTANVILLEARQACSGATGRNGGHTKAASYRSFIDHERRYGTAEAVKIARLEYANVQATHRLAREHGIDCASTPCHSVDIIYSQSHLDRGTKAIQKIKEALGADDPAAEYHIWTADDAREKFLCPGALGAFSYLAGSLSAYQFAVGLLKLALDKGLNLQTNTPVTSIHPSTNDSHNSTWYANTPRGNISTTNLILATNGYTAHLLPEMQGLIVPCTGKSWPKDPASNCPRLA
jgi:glycine/D-amino acid oxidase-like deaminating enzyme